MLPDSSRNPFFRLLAMLAVLCAAGPAGAAQPPANGLSGVVRSERGEALPGAMVVAENREATPHMFTTTTDQAGTFVFVGVQPGRWNVSASAAGYLLSQQVVQVSRGRGRAVTLTLKKGLWTVPDSDREPTPDKGGSRGEDVKNPSGLTGVNLSRLQTSLRNADTLLAARQYDQAIAAYQDVLKQAPALTLVNLQIAEAWRMKKDYDRAIDSCRAVLATDAGNSDAMEAIGLVELERGRPDAAEEMLAAALRHGARGRSTLCALGDVKAAQGQLDDAAEWYRKSSAADPGWSTPILKLGLLAARREDREAAISFLEKVIRMAPDSQDAADAARALRELKNRS